MFIALFNTQSIVSILMFCFTLRAAGSFFPYVMGHYWKKASTAGTIASLIAGTIVVVYLEHISKGMLFGIKFSQPIIPGLAAASSALLSSHWPCRLRRRPRSWLLRKMINY